MSRLIVRLAAGRLALRTADAFSELRSIFTGGAQRRMPTAQTQRQLASAVLQASRP
jgi:hypothetical protein